MGYIKEPKNIDFIIQPSVQNQEDKRAFSEAIAKYKKTGELSEVPKGKNPAATHGTYRDIVAKIRNKKE
ncbi:hypothetical protein SAMN06265348_104222 [Pedobacter westerhofensis]|uniref:Uncharacterized protein n=1 Tax=Pedobacter westerhofensis TaxID=425512 RepID=A0A521CWN6_9SPHI|nr:hypothetical protein [Pedobacter westerhofensis]SMO63151.1 hypothetical protein SAMN06265348_104222 [Pedobacter westerhofensis]